MILSLQPVNTAYNWIEVNEQTEDYRDKDQEIGLNNAILNINLYTTTDKIYKKILNKASLN